MDFIILSATEGALGLSWKSSNDRLIWPTSDDFRYILASQPPFKMTSKASHLFLNQVRWGTVYQQPGGNSQQMTGGSKDNFCFPGGSGCVQGRELLTVDPGNISMRTRARI